MNFDNYFELLQKTEKPTFVFERFDNKEITILCLQEVKQYLIEKAEESVVERKYLG